MKILVAAGALLLSACTTTIAYRPVEADKIPRAALKGKTASIVIDESQVPNAVKTTSETESFEFTGMSDVVRESLKSQLEFSGSKAYVVSSAMSAGKDTDFVLKPQLTVRSVYDFWTFGCLATYKIEVFGKKGELIMSVGNEAKRNFVFTSQAENKCNEAFKELITGVNDKALNSVPR